MLGICPNKNHPDWVSLVSKIGINQAYVEFYKSGMNIPDPSRFEASLEGINATLKVVDALTSPKTEQLFNRFFSNNKDKFYSELTQLAGKDQVQLVKDFAKENNVKTLPDLVTGLLAESSYTTQIKTADAPFDSSTLDDGGYGFKSNGAYYSQEQEWGGKVSYMRRTLEGDSKEVTKEEFKKAEKEADRSNSSYYSNLTVAGGTNYTENEISTPQIEPSIKGHAQFSTKNGIGWFRSDTKADTNITDKQREETNKAISAFGEPTEEDYKFNPTKTRRILEVQSDLFQKGRDRADLISNKTHHNIGDIIKTDKGEFEFQGYKTSLSEGVDFVTLKNLKTGEVGSLNLKTFEKRILEVKKSHKQNQFLQLLNKDNNWVNFFIKSIIQDSSRKGYEEVHFPTGDTASKVEGHTTLEEHKANIQKGLNEAKNHDTQKEYNSIKENKEKTLNYYKDILKKYKPNTLDSSTDHFIKPSIVNSKYEFVRVRENDYNKKYGGGSTLTGDNYDGWVLYEYTVGRGNETKKITNDRAQELLDKDNEVKYNLLKKDIEEATNDLKELNNNKSYLRELEKNKEERVKEWQKQLNDIQTEGFAKLKPIHNFYENVVHNILKKNYNVERVTDEHKNDWFKIKLDSSHNTPIYFQKESTSPKESKELNDRLEPFFKNIGVSLKEVSSIKDENGNSIGAIAAANILHKTIEIVKGEAKIDTLPEEASHFMISILKNNNSPLYSSMMNEIEDYQIFKDTLQSYGDLYKGNETKLKEEAIGKLVSQMIVDKFEDEQKAPRANRWWNRVLNYIKEKLGVVNKEDLEYTIINTDPFSQTAEAIMDKKGFNRLHLNLDDNVSDGEREQFYQLRNPKELEDRILNKYPLIEGKNGNFILNGTEVKNTLRQKVSAYLEKKYQSKSDYEKQQQQAKAEKAGKGHDDMANAIQRAVAERDGKVAPAKVVSTNETIYSKLEDYAKSLVSSLPVDSKILTNVPIYDKKSDTATKLDLLVIHPDSKVSVYDWKFTEMGKSGKVNSYSLDAYQRKMSEVKNILQNSYGIEKFDKLRNIPIEANFNKTNLLSVKIGSTKIEDTAKNLLPIPLNEEMTGDEKLDRIIQTLLKKKEDLEKSKPLSTLTIQEKSLFNEKKIAALGQVKDAIRDIQLKQDLKQYVSIGLNAIDELTNTSINDYSREHLLDLIKTMDFYGQNMLGLVHERVSQFSDTDKAELFRLSSEAQLWSSKIEAELASRLLSTGNQDLLEPQKETGVIGRMFRTISQQNHPIIKEFWNKLVLPAKAKTREAATELNNKIKNSLEELQKAFPGLRQGDLFKFMIDEGKNGQLSITAKYKQEFYDRLTKARDKIKSGEERNDYIELIKMYGKFDQEAYNKDYAQKVKDLAYIYRNDPDKDEKISDRIKSFRNKNDDEIGLSNPYNPYFKLNEDPKVYSDKYNKIQNTPALKNFYDLWMKHSEEFREIINQKSLGSRFLWNVRNGLVDSMMENGFGAFTNMSSILDELEAKSGDTLGMVDPNTGLPTYEVPAYYTQPSLIQNEKGEYVHDSKNQSRDLGKVLSLVGAMAYNHKYMSDIEGSSKSLEMLLSKQEAIQVDTNGNPIKNKLTGEVQKVLGSASTLEQFRDYINYYIYGIRNKSKDKTFNLPFTDRTFSSLAVYSKLSQWFVGKALIGNPVSIMAHLFRSDLNARILAGTDRFFNGKELNKSIARIATRDRKSMQLLSYFDIMDAGNLHLKAEQLSTRALGDALTWDKMFIGHEMTDRAVKNSILLSLTQSHYFDENLKRIVKIPENGEQTSLHDYIDMSGEKPNFKDISPENLEAFRNKVNKIASQALGNGNRDDIRLIGLTILGKSLMTFRNWIPNMVYARFGDLRHDEDLETYELGRYKTFWNTVATKKVLPLLLDGVKGFGFFGYGGKFGDTTINRAKELYQEYLEKNPNTRMTEQDYIDLHLSNVRGNMMETYIMLALMGTIAAVSPDKDKHERLKDGTFQKWYVHQLERAKEDMMFFYNPVEFNKLLKSPLPVVNTYMTAYHLVKAFGHEGESLITGQPVKGTTKHELRTASLKMIPGLAGFESLLSFTQDDYDKTNSLGTDSSSK